MFKKLLRMIKPEKALRWFQRTVICKHDDSYKEIVLRCRWCDKVLDED